MAAQFDEQSLADSIAGTADEVDTDARRAAIDPAPAQPKELLENDDFDVSVSTSLNRPEGPELDQDDEHDQDSKAKHAAAAELHAQANADAAQFLDDTNTMLLQHRQHRQQEQQYRSSDARYDDATELEEPESESNIGSESPARRSVLELPPALDLADTGGILAHADDSLPSPSSSLLADSDPISGETLDAIPDILEDVPLASPTTDAVMFQAAQQQQQQNAYSQEGYLTREEEAQGSGLGISTGPPADGQGQQQQSQNMQQQQQPPQMQPDQAGNFVNGLPGPIGPQPSPKQPTFAYHHDDTDTTMAELEEFFSYVEIRGVIEEGRTSWARGWESMGTPEWPEAPNASKKAHIYHLIEELEHRDPEIRFEAARRIAYIAHGAAVFSRSCEWMADGDIQARRSTLPLPSITCI